MASSLFDDLPPPSAPPPREPSPPPQPPVPLPSAPSILKSKSALKRPASDSQNEGGKQVRFKASVPASNEKVIEAIGKLSSYIGNPEKFSKASKLAMRLVTETNMSSDVSSPFFDMLRVTMCPPTKANEAAVRADYSALFSTVKEKIECFTPSQQAQIDVWMIWAELANEFFTDDTFMFSRAAGRLKQAIDLLPEADEASSSTGPKPEEGDPFGLDALLDEKQDSLLEERRGALLQCLTNCVGRYKQKWAQTIIDIAAKHAVDNRHKFSAPQQRIIEQMWSSVKEQQIKRRQGKSSSGKLDETSFEKLREKYSHKKISIRKAVGSGGERSAEQWLG